jgi:Ca2+/Na+ antiporter
MNKKIKKNFFSYIPLFIISTLIILILVRSEITFEGAKRSYYSKYYLIFFTLFILSIFFLYLNEEIKKYTYIILISLITTFYFFEYYLNKFSRLEVEHSKILKIKENLYKKNTGKIWDKRTQYQVYKDLLKINSTIVPYFYPQEFLLSKSYNKKIHSLSGVSNSDTIFCNENGYFSINKSDRYGFNNPDESWESNNVEYVFVGDSVTHGYCVNRPNDIPSVVRSLTKMNVLNLGYGRNGPLIEYATLREYLPSKVNKIVFMYYGGGDLVDLKNELTSKILNNYLNDENYTQNLRELQNEIDYEARKNIEIRAKGEKFSLLFLNKTRRLFDEIFKSNKNIIKTSSFDDEHLFDKLEKILFLVKKLSVEKKSDLYIVDLPAQRYFKNYSCNRGGSEFHHEFKNSAKMKKIAQKLEIQYIDIHEEVFQKELNPCKLFPFEIFAHYNVEGHKKVALKIYEKTK